MLEIDGINIQWNGHDGFRLKVDNKIIYIESFQINSRVQQQKGCRFDFDFS